MPYLSPLLSDRQLLAAAHGSVSQLSDCSDEDEQRDVVREYLEEHTVIVGETDAGFIYQTF